MIKCIQVTCAHIMSILPNFIGDHVMNKITKYLILIGSGVSFLLPILYLYSGIPDASYSSSFVTEVIIGICAGMISTACVHTKELHLSYQEFLQGRYVIKDTTSRPWNDRSWDAFSIQNNVFGHFMITFMYTLAIYYSVQDECVPAVLLSIFLTLYYGTIAVLFLRRDIQIGETVKEKFAYEQMFERVSKKYKGVIKNMLTDKKWSYYQRDNLHDELPLDIRDQIEKDLKKMQGEQQTKKEKEAKEKAEEEERERRMNKRKNAPFVSQGKIRLNFKDFEDDLEDAINSQIQTTKHIENSFSEYNSTYANSDLLMAGEKRIEEPYHPVINVYFDLSGSCSAEVAATKQKLSFLTKFGKTQKR